MWHKTKLTRQIENSNYSSKSLVDIAIKNCLVTKNVSTTPTHIKSK